MACRTVNADSVPLVSREVLCAALLVVPNFRLATGNPTAWAEDDFRKPG